MENRRSLSVYRCFRIRFLVLVAGLFSVVAYTYTVGAAPAASPATSPAGTGSGSGEYQMTNSLPRVVINEILASNGSGIEDEDGDTVPWIELYNAGTESVDLQYYGLSDNAESPWKWVFPDITIEPNDFLLVFASGKDRSDPQGELHASFRVSQSGDELLLTDWQGNQIDYVPPTPMPTDVSFGRQSNGTDNWYYFNSPTPGSTNNKAGFQTLTPPPEFSQKGGFYASGFDLQLTAGSEISFSEMPGQSFTAGSDNVVIRYTLDGSEPDENSRLYDGVIRIDDRTQQPNTLSAIRTSAIEGVRSIGFEWKEPAEKVFKGTVIRARAFRPGGRPSQVITHSYFVHPLGTGRYTLPVVSIVTDSLHLFDYEKGIYIPGKAYDDQDPAERDHLVGNFAKRGSRWERPAVFELFDEYGERVHSQDIGIRIHGGASRGYPLKSLRLYARNEYGDNRFYYPIFPDQPDRDYNRLVLRNSGQDFFVRSTMFRDAFMQMLVRDFNIDTQAYQPAVIFINGEYWGIQNFRERYDTHYLARVYGVDPDRVDLLTHNARIKDGSNDHYEAMIDYIRDHDPALETHYRHIQTMMDTDNYLDYLIAQVFIRNLDFPGNNIDYWRMDTEWHEGAKSGHDGRWRWLLFDTDAGFGLMNPFRVESYNMMRHITMEGYDEWPFPEWATFLIRRLFRNEEFRNEFINRSADYLNTVIRPSHVIGLIDKFEATLEPAIEEHIKRWGQIESKDRWHFNVQRLRDFAEKRPDYVYEHTVSHFELSGTFDLNVDVSSLQRGRVQVNTLVIDENIRGLPESRDTPWPWKGTYFREVPVTLVARPYEGYRFSHWEGKGLVYAMSKGAEAAGGSSFQNQGRESETIMIAPRTDLSVKAVFVPDDAPSDRVPAAHTLVEEDYLFTFWDADAEPGTYPSNMIFQYMEEADPGLRTPAAGFTSGAYNLSDRTRVNGKGDKGFSFLNTSSSAGNPGYPGTRLGAAVLALDTRDMRDVTVSWTGGTVEPNSRIYNLRLQYRINGEGTFLDVLDDQGKPVEYKGHHEEGHSHHFGEVPLPAIIQNKPYVELRWKYYYTGVRRDNESGARAMLRVGEIHVTGDYSKEHRGEAVEGYHVMPNYPNPFNDATMIQVFLQEESQVSITVYDMSGRLVKRVRDNVRLSAGHHTIRMNASGLASGMYVYRVDTPNWTGHGKMTLIR